MPLSKGDKLGPYEMLGLIGKGGMGEVFRAQDTRLGRTVAIKVIPPHLAVRQELRQRFEIEARAIASLNHPHICALFDIGEQDGTAYMVMEYLEGQSLAECLKKGPLPFEEAVRYAIHIVDALDQAHRRGVFHRDIKPGNMMLIKGGVKLLDFGLARLQDRASVVGTDELTVSLTHEGTVLGTPQYMAPEQVEGRDVDGRADIFAFASVLYEMLTGRKAFSGKDVGELMTSVLRCEPPSPMDGIPFALNRALRTCWARDPDERWQSAGDLRRELEWIAKGDEAAAAPVIAQGMNRREMLAWSTAVIGTVGAAAITRSVRSTPPAPARVRFTITENVNRYQSLPSISPDGKMVALMAGRSHIWIRALESTELRELPGTDTAGSLFWSPDSRWLAFFADNQLKRISPAGGPAEKICDTPIGSGGTWNRQDVIVFQKDRDGALFQVAAMGGNPTPATVMSEGQTGHKYPTFLPDGKKFLFSVVDGKPEQQGIFAATLGSTESRRISPLVSNVRFAQSGHLLFAQGGNLVAQSFDPVRLSLEGEGIQIASNLWTYERAGAFDLSTTGTLVYAEVAAPLRQLTWFHRGGRSQEKVGPPGPFIGMDLSKDGQRVILEYTDGRNRHLWMMETLRGIPTPIASDPDNPSWEGHWSPDGTQFVYALTTGRPTALYRKNAGAAGLGEKLRVSPNVPAPATDWSPDGKYIVFRQANQNGVHDLGVLDVSGQGPVAEVKYLSAPHALADGRISPDGRWMAYTSSKTKSPEIFVSPFPIPTAGEWRISANGGFLPRWRADGKELFFLAPDGMLMAAPIPSTPDRAGVPVALVRCDTQYAPSADGQRFLVNTRLGEARQQTMQVILGWRP